MKVSNLTSPRSGSKVANQYNIESDEFDTFQSYETVIAKRELNNGSLTISTDWNYSRTTAKYFASWLEDFANMNRFEIETLKKWLKKDSTKPGSQLVELLGRPVNITLVEELK